MKKREEPLPEDDEGELLSLDAFIQQNLARQSWPANAYTRWGTLTIYARVGPRLLEGVRRPTIDLANVTADRPGRGEFKRLVRYLRSTYPSYALYVECVLTKRFQEGLLRLGFSPTAGHPDCFHLTGDMSDEGVQPR